ERRVLTVIEILSPANKKQGPGRDLYLEKQRQVLASRTNLVEIDLLRGGSPTVSAPPDEVPATEYRVVVNRADRRETDVYACGLREPGRARGSLPLALSS